MALTLEREWSLTDLRKTQRRVTALLLVDDHSERQKYPLRRKVLPKIYCYVCSRIDPGGIFRNPNSYLFRQGFSHACEHFPKAPYSTFIGEEINVNIKDSDADIDGDVTGDVDDVATDVETDTSQRHSISVTIRHGSSVTKFGSPLRRERTSEPSGSTDRLTSQRPSNSHSGHELPSQRDTRPIDKTRLPSVYNNRHALSLVKDKSHIVSGSHAKPTQSDERTKNTTSEPANRPTGVKDHALGRDESSQDERPGEQGTASRITVIPTGDVDDRSYKSDEQSRKTGPSTFSKGGPSASKSSRDFEPVSAPVTKVRITNTAARNHTDLESVVHSQRYINETDGLGMPVTVTPLVRDVIDLEVAQLPPYRRSQVRRARVKEPKPVTRVPAEVTADEERPDSGRLRYHHRGEDDSVPDPGFEMAPTPSELERLELERLEHERLLEQHRLEAERKAIEDLIADGNVFLNDTSSKGLADNSSTDDASLHFSESASRAKSKLSRRTLSGEQSFCRCNSSVREKSFTKTTCLVCGKRLPYGSGKPQRESSWGSRGHNGAAAPPGSNCSHSSKSRRKMLQEAGPRDSKTDEDYMDLESIIHEDDGHYWSSDDDISKSYATERSSLLRFKNAKPYPLVDPNLHKLVYIQALKQAQIKGKHRNDEEFDELNHIRRPNVFSYYPLLRYAGRGEPDSIGLRAEEGVKIQKGQFMKHIFGEVKLDEFYPGGSREVLPKSKAIINDGGEATLMSQAKEASTSKAKGVAKKPRRKLPEIPKAKGQPEQEQEPVGLKMRKDS